MHMPLLMLHITSAIVGLLSGFMAMGFRKGSGLHGAAGTVFFVSMVSMSLSAVYIAAFLRPIMINVIAGLLTFYLISTSRLAAKRRQGGTNSIDRGAVLYAVALGAAGYWFGVQAANAPRGMLNGVPAAVYFVFGSIALLCAVNDVRMIKRGGALGAKRIARHLWRMCLALLIATLSFYPGQAKLFPKWLRATNLLFIPMILLIGAMFFWLYRVSVRKRVPSDRVIPNPVVAAGTHVAGVMGRA
jgi:uncharacterized membrane protein